MAESEEPRSRGRRNFLKMGLYSGAAAAVGYPLVRVGMWWNRRPGEGLQALSTDEYLVIESMAEAMFPPGGPLGRSAREYPVALFVDAQIAVMNQDLGRVMKVALSALEDMTILDDWGLTPFTDRPLEERIAILQAWERSETFEKRSMLRVYKWYVCMGLCDIPGVLEQLGVDYLCM